MPRLFKFSASPVLALLSIVSALAVAASTCEPRLPTPVAVSAARIVIFGEIHGTQQIPEAVANRVCSLITQGKTVRLVLEIPANEQERIDTYMKSRGQAEDQEAMLAGAFWSRPLINNRSIQDGRASKAMLALLERARQHAQATGRLAVVAASAYKGRQDTDELMATAIRVATQDGPEVSVVALMGSVHASGARGTPWDAAYEGVGYRLHDLMPVIVDVQHAGGSAWVCMSGTCEEKKLFAPTAYHQSELGYGPPERQVFTWSLRLGVVSASPPAVPD